MGQSKRGRRTNKFVALFLVLLMMMQFVPSFSAFAASDPLLELVGSIKAGGAPGGATITEVASGDAFILQLSYTFSPYYPVDEVAGTYHTPGLSVQIPNYLNAPTEAQIMEITNNSDIDYISGPTVLGNYYMYNVFFYENAGSGVAKTINIPLSFKNLETANGTTATFNATLSSQVDTATGETGSVSQAITNPPTVTAVASEPWELTKTADDDESLQVASDPNYKYVLYTIEMDYESATTAEDRNGRLDFAKDANGKPRFALTDTLPIVDGIGNSGAELVSIKMEDWNGTALAYRDLAADEFSRRNDGTTGELLGLTINTYRKNHEDKVNIPEGAPMKTKYQILVKYPYAKFATPSDQPQITYHDLVNNASLDYTLIGPDTQNLTDQDTTQIGKREDPKDAQDLIVKKFVKIGSKTILLDSANQAIYGDAKFTLYTDRACTSPANNINAVPLPVDVAIGANGTLTFASLRPGQKFYLKETETLDGFETPAIIELELDALTGAVTYTYLTDPVSEDQYNADGIVQVFNETKAGGMGIVEFTKKGIPAASATKANLAGFTFELLDEDGNSLSPALTATSGTNGYVLFPAVPAGSYKLKETGVPTAEYTADSTLYDVTVAGNDVVTLNIAAFGEAGVFLNTSDKGTFKLFKTNSSDTPIGGAIFDIYGPSATAPTVGTDTPILTGISVPTTGYTPTSPLAPGTYWAVETAAPTGYVLNSTPTSFVVARNSTAEVRIGNVRYGQLIIKKWGSRGDVLKYERLGGVVFNLYTDAAYGNPVLDADGVPVTYTSVGPSTPELELNLAPNTYYYKEVAAPAKYETVPEESEGSFTITEGNKATIDVHNKPAWGWFTIEKIDSKTNKPLIGATFKVYDTNIITEETVPVDTIVVDAQGKGISTLLDVDGTYYIVESTVPNGYRQPIEIINGVDGSNVAVGSGTGFKFSSIPAGQDKVIHVIVKNDPTVTINIKKTDAEKNASGRDILIQGITFRMYQNEEDATADTNWREVTTNASGIASFSNLVAGHTYYFRENSTGTTPYILDNAVFSVTAPTIGAASLTLEVTRTNKMPGTLKIKKTGTFDGADVSMQGVVFEVYKNATGNRNVDIANLANKLDGTITIGANGEGTMTNVAPGTYWVKEITPKEGFGTYTQTSPAIDTPIEVKSGDNVGVHRSVVHVTAVNLADKGKLKLKKVGSQGAKPGLSGAVFTVYAPKTGDGSVETHYDTTDTDTIVTKLTTGADGTITSGFLTQGNYLVVETTSPANYSDNAANKRIVAVAAGLTTDESTTPFENDPKGRITITKTGTWFVTDGEDEGRFQQNLPGGVFVIYKRTTNTGAGNVAADFAADAADVNSFVTDPVNYTSSNLNFIQKLTTLADGSITSVYLDAGEYWVYEIKAPDGYARNTNPFSVTVPKTGTPETNTVAQAVDNKPNTGRIRGIKVDLMDHDILLDGAQFELYVVVDEPGEGVILLPDETTYVKQIVIGDLESGTEEGKGTFLTDAIEPGKTYYLRETREPLHSEGNYKMVEEWTGPITGVVAGGIKEVIIENYEEATAPGTKYDQDDQPLADAYIGIFANSSDATTLNNLLKAGTITLVSTQAAEDVSEDIYYVDGEAFKTAYNVTDVAVSGTDGIFAFEGLIPGQTYHIIELLAPANYMRDETEYKMTVNNTGDGFTETLSIIDYHYGQIKLRKETTLSGVDYPLNGATFAIYEAVERPDSEITEDHGNHICNETTCKYYIPDGATPVYTGITGTTGTSVVGEMISGFLPPGQYIVVETIAPEGYEIEDDPVTNEPIQYHVSVEANETNDYLAGGEGNVVFHNKAIYGDFIMIKTDDAGTRISATFKLQKKNSESGIYEDYMTGSPSAVYSFTVPTTGDFWQSMRLPAGDYQIVETNVATQYVMSDPILFSIEGGKTTNLTGPVDDTLDPEAPNPIVAVNDRKGNLTLDKYGYFVEKGDPDDTEVKIRDLNGVVFEIYPRTSASATTDRAAAVTAGTIQTLTTNASGRATLNNIVAGNYWLGEQSVGTGNPEFDAANFTPFAITIEKGNTLSFTGAGALKNETTYGYLEIIKTDANDGTKFLGATFEVYDNATGTGTPITTITTDSITGIGRSPILLNPAESYWLKETTSPTGYFPIATIIGGVYGFDVNITSGSAGERHNITNVKKITLTVKKQDSTNASKSMAGVVFELFPKLTANIDADYTTAGTGVKTATVGTGNLATFNELTPNTTYWLREKSSITGYVANSGAFIVTTTNATPQAFSYTPEGASEAQDYIGNDPMGKIKLKKIAKWTVGESVVDLPLNGAIFTIYAYDANEPNNAGEETGTITTSGTGTGGVELGEGTSDLLVPGKYVVKETTAPTNFVANSTYYVIDVAPGEEDLTLYNTPVVNTSAQGRFIIHKIAGVRQEGVTPTYIPNVSFKLEKLTGTNPDAWTDLGTITTDASGKHESTMYDIGTYRITETAVGDEWVLDATPYVFEIKAQETIEFDRSNYAKGEIVLTKYKDALNGSGVLQGVSFKLQKDGQDVPNSTQITNSTGKITWTNLDPGLYTIVEVNSVAGFGSGSMGGEIEAGNKVTIPGDSAVKVVKQVTATNVSNMGRILILKTDESGTRLSGAKFKIEKNGAFVEDAFGEGISEGTTENDGTLLTALLPVDDYTNGTVYTVVETEAAPGYSLDSRIHEIRKDITVYPLHHPTETVAKNAVTFTNTASEDLGSFPGKITKTITPTQAEKSLHVQTFDVTFGLKDFADGKNKVPMTNFTVTDNNITMEKLDGVTGVYSAVTPKSGDYRFNKVRIYRAYNAAGGAVSATVQYQTFEQKGGVQWTTVKLVDNLNGLAVGAYETVDLSTLVSASTTIAAVRVVYAGVQKNFYADGIEMDVRFAVRPSSADEPEIRKVTNTAILSYAYDTYDEEGTLKTERPSYPSDKVEAFLPSMEELVPTVTVRNEEITPNKDFFAVGQTAHFRATGENVSSNGAPLQQPVMSAYLPPFTQLTGTYSVRKYYEDGSYDILNASNYTVVESTVDALVPKKYISGNPADGELVPLPDGVGGYYQTTALTFTFTNEPGGGDFVLNPGERIEIYFDGILDVSKPDTISTLVSPVFLTSNYALPISEENKKGTSFIVADSTVQENDDLSGIIGNDRDFSNNNKEIIVANATELNIYKQIKGPYDNAFNAPGIGSTVYPSGEFEYRITFTNMTESVGDKINIIDLLPVLDDLTIKRNTSRNTTLEKRPELLSVAVDSASLPEGATSTTYYTSLPMDGTSRNARAASWQDELPVLADSDETFAGMAGWSTGSPSAATTGFGVEILFGDTKFAKGDAITLTVRMKAPEYTGLETAEFLSKIMSNSTAGAMHTVGATDMGLAVENEKVDIEMILPLGSIGDYMFDDANHNGLQDETDIPMAGRRVTLTRTEHSAGGTETPQTFTTTTDPDGKYLFENQPCNFLDPTLSGGINEDDPNNYIGGKYYTYVVEFSAPPEYTPTIKQIASGAYPTIDSDVSLVGTRVLTDELRLAITMDDDLNMEAEHNLDIDAGFIIPGVIGDKVWIDENRDGEQNQAEPGLNDVRVNLYRKNVDGVFEYLATTMTGVNSETGEEGMYYFYNLTPGEYRVEFDITDFMVAGTNSYKYAFTTSTVVGIDDEFNSDAEEAMDAAGRIMRTRSIIVGERDEQYQWDAGVVEVSALAGFVFDDQDYDDLQSLSPSIPLTGTKVLLYRASGGIRVGDAIDSRTLTAADEGRYLFDNLIPGEYQVFFQFPEGYKAVKGNVGSDDTIDSDCSEEIASDFNSGYSHVITLPAGVLIDHIDAGARKYGKIGDYVWLDANINGIQDAGEAPIANVEVVIERRTAEGLWQYHDRTFTNEDGFYEFQNLESGVHSGWQYRIVFKVTDPFLHLTSPGKGGDIEKDSDAIDSLPEGGYFTAPIDLGYGAEDMSIDAGFFRSTGTIGDLIWYDNNKDGIQNDGPSGIENVWDQPGVMGLRVVLEGNDTDTLDEDAWKEVGELYTDEDGMYLFTDLQPGQYRVKFQMLAGYTATLQNATGENFELSMYDSDPFREASGGWHYTRSFYLEEGGELRNWDMGIHTGEDPDPGKTGDTARATLYMAIMLLTVGMFLVLALYKKKDLTER